MRMGVGGGDGQRVMAGDRWNPRGYFEDLELVACNDAILAEITTPQVGITIDTGHFFSAGVDWRPFIHKYADRIYNVHVKDHIGTQSVALGQGQVDLRGYVQELDAINYEGALAVELEVEDPENLPRYCAEAYTLLDELVCQVTGHPPARD